MRTAEGIGGAFAGMALLFAVLLSALKVLLHRYARQDDICVGARVETAKIDSSALTAGVRSLDVPSSGALPAGTINTYAIPQPSFG